ncbi:MAG: MaoC family dehydratase [Acidobacteria bacterium]|nr:MaoC family dehydratase [Acidobacteriota bacterium]
MPRRIDPEELPGLVGREVAVSGWIEVTQQRIDDFAEATGDRQWIHADPERAAAESPFGTAVAHGFLTLSLLTQMAGDAFELSRRRLGVNYGLNRVRFPAPVPSGARVRGRFTLAACDPIEGGFHLTWSVRVETDGGGSKPCLAAEWVTRALF